MRRSLLWIVPPGILLFVLAEWALLASPGGRLVGLVLLSILLGFIGVFALAPVTVAVGAVADRWGTAAAVVLVGACLSVGVLAIIGSIERSKPGYVWKYGEPADVAVPHATGRARCPATPVEGTGRWTGRGWAAGSPCPGTNVAASADRPRPRTTRTTSTRASWGTAPAPPGCT